MKHKLWVWCSIWISWNDCDFFLWAGEIKRLERRRQKQNTEWTTWKRWKQKTEKDENQMSHHAHTHTLSTETMFASYTLAWHHHHSYFMWMLILPHNVNLKMFCLSWLRRLSCRLLRLTSSFTGKLTRTSNKSRNIGSHHTQSTNTEHRPIAPTNQKNTQRETKIRRIYSSR